MGFYWPNCFSNCCKNRNPLLKVSSSVLLLVPPWNEIFVPEPQRKSWTCTRMHLQVCVPPCVCTASLSESVCECGCVHLAMLYSFQLNRNKVPVWAADPWLSGSWMKVGDWLCVCMSVIRREGERKSEREWVSMGGNEPVCVCVCESACTGQWSS